MWVGFIIGASVFAIIGYIVGTVITTEKLEKCLDHYDEDEYEEEIDD